MLIVGIGNPTRGDDAAGLLAAQRLRALLPEARVEEFEGDLTSLIDRWAYEAQVIVIDAVASGADPGTIHRLDAGSESLRPLGFRGSTHALGLAEMVELSRVLGRLPACLIVYGIEAADFRPGAGVSSPVAAAIEETARRIAMEVPCDA